MCQKKGEPLLMTNCHKLTLGFSDLQKPEAGPPSTYTVATVSSTVALRWWIHLSSCRSWLLSQPQESSCTSGFSLLLWWFHKCCSRAGSKNKPHQGLICVCVFLCPSHAQPTCSSPEAHLDLLPTNSRTESSQSSHFPFGSTASYLHLFPFLSWSSDTSLPWTITGYTYHTFQVAPLKPFSPSSRWGAGTPHTPFYGKERGTQHNYNSTQMPYS